MSDIQPCELELSDEPVIGTNPYDKSGAWLSS